MESADHPSLLSRVREVISTSHVSTVVDTHSVACPTAPYSPGAQTKNLISLLGPVVTLNANDQYWFFLDGDLSTHATASAGNSAQVSTTGLTYQTTSVYCSAC